MPVNNYEALWIFLIYAVLGWCVEVAYAGLNQGIFVNRGFLNGPYCPIYGCGMLIVTVTLSPLQDNLLLLFLGSCLLTTILEYLTGLALEKVFGHKWWDYSDIPFNIQGYVCPKFSILWGLGGTFIMKVIHPLIYKGIQWIPRVLGIIILSVLFSAFLVDVCVTVNTILKLNKKLRGMQKIADAMHRLSDEVGEDIFEKVLAMADKSEEVQEEWKEKIVEAKALREEYKTMLENRQFGFKRLAKAFPDMKSKKWDEVLQQCKEALEKKKN